jgi:hypothetical protein
VADSGISIPGYKFHSTTIILQNKGARVIKECMLLFIIHKIYQIFIHPHAFFFLVFPGLGFPSLFQHDSPGKHCRRRKARTVFSDQQLNGLEKRFEAQRYLSTPERVELATQLNLTETQVRYFPV